MKTQLHAIQMACLSILLLSITSVNAQTIATMTFDWSSLDITANGTSITPVWQEEFDGPDYIYNLDAGVNQFATIYVPNPGFANTNTLAVNEPPFGAGLATQTPTTLDITVNNQFTSDFDALTFRTGQFIAPVSGVYTFAMDYTGSLEVNNTNTELGNTVFASASSFIEYTKNGATNNNQDGNFVFQELDFSISNMFGTQALTGQASINQTFGGNDVVFAAGDLITFNASTRVQNQSFSTQPPVLATPIPAALPLMLSGLSLFVLSGVKRRRRCTY